MAEAKKEPAKKTEAKPAAAKPVTKPTAAPKTAVAVKADAKKVEPAKALSVTKTAAPVKAEVKKVEPAKAAPAPKPAVAPKAKPVAASDKPAPVAKTATPVKAEAKKVEPVKAAPAPKPAAAPAKTETRVFVPKAPAAAPAPRHHEPRPAPSVPVKAEDVRVKKTGGTKIKMNGTHATGRRKKSVARVRLVPGSGKIIINDRPLTEYFASGFLQLIVNQPLVTAEVKNVDVLVNVHGGGLTGQAGAIRHGIARALVKDNEQLKPDMKRKGFLKRDPRMKERKKYGLKKARRAPQFSKR